MDYTSAIVQLYNDVYDLQQQKFNVSFFSFGKAVHDINEAYSKNPDWQNDHANKMTDYNKPAQRSAYLHKYAMIHTGLVCELLQTILQEPSIYRELASKKQLSLCSLGGGPGTEIVSLLFAIQEIFGSRRCKINVVDYSLEWKEVFESIISELKTGRYGQVKSIVSDYYFEYNYLSADLLNTSYYNALNVHAAVKNADIITMIKFVSAVACDKTKSMLKKIFQSMKPGGMLLFVDNAAGGFDKMIREAAYECGMMTVFGPLKHYDYENSRFSVERYGYKSQSKTRVTVEMWKKPPSCSYNATAQLQRDFIYGPPSRLTNQSHQNITLRKEHTSLQLGTEERCCSII